MSDRNEALAVLKQARDKLLVRMTEAILEQAEEIVADAEGESFLSEIETLYDQMGNKLAHLNQMIANLPAEPVSPETSDLFAREDQADEIPPARLPHFPLATQSPMELAPHVERDDLIGLPAPGVSLPKAPAFARFVSHIEQGETDQAGDIIAQILGLSPYSGMKCAETFSARYQSDTAVVVKAMRIRQELTQNRFNDALMLMHECFGLQGMEAMIALQKMREIIAAPSNS
ncbi:hypothetical protein C5Y96_16510 [Blastopirellula marina]|uniref:Uncharacterized protein n=1 Tax=Blastopirellula marina TaxID=124 RepID=A0A2S8F744_9BACT|nr:MULTISPECIES: hypothetical protein [Pirellulaceae]PQO27979.1 hypothetical protein C5Y96_16510 [Blastopirellula marina]RCS48404.1 hypothetical protein DTL36_16530 [Bremerella cremea]